MDKTLEEDGFMETSISKNGMKGSHLLLDDRSLGRRETGITKIMPTGNAQEVRTRAHCYRRQEQSQESCQPGHRGRWESEMVAGQKHKSPGHYSVR